MAEPITTDSFPHHPESVPAELKAGERWVTCDEYKVPLIAIENGACFAASSTNAETWRSYETALTAYSENEHISGVGRVICEDEDYVGVDIDDCLDPDTGEISDGGSAILTRLASYAEISPSLTGVKIWATAPEITRAYKKPGLEIYPQGRYFTVTGLVTGELRPIRDVSDEITTIIEEEFPRVNRSRCDSYSGPDRSLDLCELLDRADVGIFEEDVDNSGARRFAIRCPWFEEHSGADETGTRCGQYENGALFFTCEHAHCGHRDWWAFRRYLEALIYLGRPPRAERGRLR